MNTLAKIIVIVGVALVAAGCKTVPPSITTQTIPVAVPLLYAPEPRPLDRPELPHLAMTPEDVAVDGKVVQAYAATIETLLGYSVELETELDYYRLVYQSYAALREKVIADWEARTGETITIENPPELPRSIQPNR